MSYVKPPLSPEEKEVVEELLKLSGGMAFKKELSFLNSRQSALIQNLKAKGYVVLSKKHFTVLLPP